MVLEAALGLQVEWSELQLRFRMNGELYFILSIRQGPLRAERTRRAAVMASDEASHDRAQDSLRCPSLCFDGQISA